MKHDVVIIGAGLGGLLCGYMLCKEGLEVVVIEKNPRVGGCLQSFTRQGYTFDTGMHYVGSLDEGQLLYRFWKYFGLADTIPLRKLDPEAFDTLSIGGNRYASAMGYETYIDTLCRYFPAEQSHIRDYVNAIHALAVSSPLSRLEESEGIASLDERYIRESASQYIESITPNPMLRNVLCGNLPLYGGLKGKTPFFIHGFIHNSYIQSAYRIVGGSQTVADRLTRSIREMGGQVLTGCEAIAFEGNRMQLTGIRCKDGRLFEARRFISAIHPQQMVKMIGEEAAKPSFIRRISRLENTTGCFTLYIGFKKQTEPYLNTNFFHYHTPDVWSCNDYTDRWPLGYLYMHQPPADGGAYADGAVVISYMRYEEVKAWETTQVGRRGEAYRQFKQQKAEQLLDALAAEFPGIRNRIAYYETSTPLSYRDYTGTTEGAMYGIQRNIHISTAGITSPRTYIPNLFMTGQNTNSHGMLGVTNGAMLTCMQILGLNHIIRAVNQANETVNSTHK